MILLKSLFCIFIGFMIGVFFAVADYWRLLKECEMHNELIKTIRDREEKDD